MSLDNLLTIAQDVAAGKLWVLVGADGTPVAVTSEGLISAIDQTVRDTVNHATWGNQGIYNLLASGAVDISLDAIIEDLGNPSARTNLQNIEDIIGWQDVNANQTIGAVLAVDSGDRYESSGSLGADFATLLDSRLTAARAANLDELGSANMPADLDTLTTRISALRAGYLDELDFDLDARLGAPAVSLAADLIVVDSNVDTINANVASATIGLAKVATELSGAGSNGTFSYLVAGAEQTVLEFSKTNIYSILSLSLDLINFTAARVLTIRVYVKTDGTNYRKVDEVEYTAGTHDAVSIAPMLNLDHNVKFTMQINTVEIGNISVPYRYVLSDFT